MLTCLIYSSAAVDLHTDLAFLANLLGYCRHPNISKGQGTQCALTARVVATSGLVAVGRVYSFDLEMPNSAASQS